MKTLKLLMLATAVSISFATIAGPDKTLTLKSQIKNETNASKQVKHVYLTTQQAMQMPLLLDAIHDQYNITFLKAERKSITLTVYHLNTIYYITGTYIEWMWLFNDTVVIRKDARTKSNL